MTVSQAAAAAPRRPLRLRGGLETWLWGTVLVLIAAGCYLGPFVLPLAAPEATDFGNVLAPIGTPGHWLGTDALGRDLLARCLYGGRVSLTVSLGAVALGLVFGGALGIVAG